LNSATEDGQWKSLVPKKVLGVQTQIQCLITVAIFVLVDADVVVRAVVGFEAPVKTDPVCLSSEQVLLVTVAALQ